MGNWDGQPSPEKVQDNFLVSKLSVISVPHCYIGDLSEPGKSSSFYDSGIILPVCSHRRMRSFGSWSVTLAPALHCAKTDLTALVDFVILFIARYPVGFRIKVSFSTVALLYVEIKQLKVVWVNDLKIQWEVTYSCWKHTSTVINFISNRRFSFTSD